MAMDRKKHRNKIKNHLLKKLHNTSLPLPLRQNMTQLLVWATKALVTRSHKQAQHLWSMMQDLLQTADPGGHECGTEYGGIV